MLVNATEAKLYDAIVPDAIKDAAPATTLIIAPTPTESVQTVEADLPVVDMPATSAPPVTFLDRAKIALRYGIPVVPALPRQKKTVIGSKEATTDLATIEQWNQIEPNYNSCLVAQAKIGAVWILDCDSPEVREQIEKDTGKKLPDTFTVSSSSAGHRYFRQNEESLKRLRNFSVHHGEKEFFSVRFDNMYCVGPLSVHPSGAIYKVVRDVEPVEAPSWLLHWLLAQGEEKKLPVTASLDGPKIPLRSHDTELTRIAGKLRGAGMEEDSIADALIEVCEKRCEGYGSDYREMCLKIAHSICKKPVGDGSIPFTDAAMQRSEQATVKQLVAGMPASANGGNAMPTSARKLVLTRADKITPKRVHWFWENRIFANKPNVLFGEPGLGKGFVGIDFIARMTTRTDFFDKLNENEPCDAVICCAEDSWDETILPRLIVAGADRTRVHFLGIQEQSAESVEEGLMHLDTDLPALRQMVDANPAIRIILIDPLATYMGELDPNKDKQVRPIYTKLAKFAEDHNVCFILVAHPNKQEQSSAINRLSGAKALNSVFRNTWLVEKNPDDPKSRLMLSVKGNLAGEDAKKGLRFEIQNIADTGITDAQGKSIENIGKLIWLDSTDKTADEALQDAVGGGRKYAQKKSEKIVEDFLLAFLSDGEAHLGSEFYRQAEQTGIETHEWVMRRLKGKHVSARKIYAEWWWANNLQALDDKEMDIRQRSMPHSQKTDADTQEWLLSLLKDGKQSVKIIRAAADAGGFNWESVRHDRRRWGVESVTVGDQQYWEADLIASSTA